ncbi:MAG: GH3 auxin-responsive promoter family protein, partial [Halobacteriovoraceae bacterium]|nr:GH3 auxin-responsive promoter family protein [Halobacteriovoraceae bacterium]
KHIDIAGEKLSFDVAENIMTFLRKEFSIQPICFIAKGQSSGGVYELLIEQEGMSPLSDIEKRVEELLLEHHHYKLARDLGQLKPAEVLNKKKPLEYYYEVCKKRISVDGNIKPEPIVYLEERL